ncbi:MAG: helix-turn-helix domain-containing protein [Mycobacterium sp.]
MAAASRVSMSNRLLEAAARLLREGGVEAVSTRAVAAAAGNQPPVLYRQFGDKNGLLEAVAVHIVEGYIAEKRRLMEQSDDPVDDLRRLWDLFVSFGFAQPECFALIYGHARRADAISAAAETTVLLLQEAIARIADQGVLRMSVERATALFQSCGGLRHHADECSRGEPRPRAQRYRAGRRHRKHHGFVRGRQGS